MTFATAVGTLVAGALGSLVAGSGGIISRFVPGVACRWNWTPVAAGGNRSRHLQLSRRGAPSLLSAWPQLDGNVVRPVLGPARLILC